MSGTNGEWGETPRSPVSPEELPDAGYWRARAGALEESVSELRRRLRALVRVLPPDCLPYLEMDLSKLEASGPAREVLDGWVETIALTPADVRTELDLLWRRLSEQDDPGGFSIPPGPPREHGDDPGGFSIPPGPP